jgi:histidyl-tRNA synthetase
MNTNPARGMRDFLPEDVRRRQYVIGVIADVYQRYGFEPLETPAVENIETLLGKYGEEGDRLIFKILKRGEGAESGQADLALRYDLTVPLARVVAEHRAKLPKFFKRYQIQPVWRADRPQKGRFREFYQCDVDAIGSKSMVVEAELLTAAAEVLKRLGFDRFTIRLNHRELLTAALAGVGIPAQLHSSALVALDKLDKATPESVEADLVARQVDVRAAAELLSLVRQGATSTLDMLMTLSTVQAVGEPIEAVRTIEKLCHHTEASGHVQFDLTLARGLSYYTGAIFEIVVPDLAGSLAGGGRYDNLIGMFCGEDIPACGISLGLERILVVMAERGMFPPALAATAADVMVVQWFADRAGLYLELASELRAAGLRVEIYPDAPDQDGKKVGDRQFKYAGARAVPFVAVIGAAELANATVTVKNMKTGEQSAVPRVDVATRLAAMIKAKA